MDTEEVLNLFQAFRRLQPHPLRLVQKEFEVARQYRIDHLMNLGMGKVEALKKGFTKSYLKENEKESAQRRHKAIMKAEIMIRQSQLHQREIDNREQRLGLRLAKGDSVGSSP